MIKNAIFNLILKLLKRDWDTRTKDIVHDVSEEDIATVVAMMTGIPVNRIAQTESEKLLKMGDVIKKSIVGQDEAITRLQKLFAELVQD